MSVHIQTYSGTEARQYLYELARLRIEVFREYPYLYEGDLAYESAYLGTFFNAPNSLLVVVFDEGKVVGVSTALPLQYESDNIKQPFLDRGYQIDRIFYYGESVLFKPYRNRGFGKRFFHHREAHARSWGAEMACFCAVIRPDDHPMRPPDYVPLDKFWKKQGFQKRVDMVCYIPWQEIGETEETPKPMVFWTKDLTQ
ncbi:N-acetyltransferase [Sphingobacteriales bacterium UPWRP_1]|nr:GNAT family N-acetyltransferase [Sphingobacteriales bacterium TSM_CSS]PSJ75919.1 N-acetyltransferase [Sphingobacteriales bacterium UPWRP_1]